jgi:histone deacetylase 11
MKTAIIYNENYNFKVPFGLARFLHRFDLQKYKRAYESLQRTWRSPYDSKVEDLTFSPSGEISLETIEAVHTRAYLESLKDPQIIARIIESPLLRHFSAKTLDERLLSPMRWAAAGTALAMEKVFSENYDIVFNLGGGYHHAFPGHGEGFCVYNDLAIGLHSLEEKKLLKSDDVIAVVDLDAHFGNGNATFFRNSKNVKIFDIYNFTAYASQDADVFAKTNPWLFPTSAKTTGASYMIRLCENLPRFLDETKPRMLFFLAGTDVYAGDAIGRFSLTQSDVFERDNLVLTLAKRRKIPVVAVTAGGYTKDSSAMVAEMARSVLRGNFYDYAA